METPRKIDDCYFYYYSTCTKGDTCHFRHEPSALGRETMCFYWQQGKCFDQQCNLRHMELRKNRKQIPCYWESQPGGCRKKFCPFQHATQQTRLGGVPPNEAAPQLQSGGPPPRAVNRETGEVSEPHRMPPTLPMAHPVSWHPHQRQVSLDSAMVANVGGPRPPIDSSVPISPLAAAYSSLPVVDSLVVNFEEESDSESMPTLTPIKNRFLDEGRRVVKIKSLEQIRLERIQAESAAFYYYDPDSSGVALQPQTHNEDSMSDDSRGTDFKRVVSTKLPLQYEAMTLDEIQHGKENASKRPHDKSDDFKILSLDEIRANKKRKMNGDVKLPANNDKASFINSKKRSHSPDISNVQAVDDKTLEAYLKSFRTTPPNKSKKLDDSRENLKVITPTKPKLIRKRHLILCDEVTLVKQVKKSSEHDNLNGNSKLSNEVDTYSIQNGDNVIVPIISEGKSEINSSTKRSKEFLSTGSNRYLLPNLIPDLIASCEAKLTDNNNSESGSGQGDISSLDDNNILKMIDEFLDS